MIGSGLRFLARVLCRSSEFGVQFCRSVTREDSAQHFAKTKVFGSIATACTTLKIHRPSSVPQHRKRLHLTRGSGTNEEANARRPASCTANSLPNLLTCGRRVCAMMAAMPQHELALQMSRCEMVPFVEHLAVVTGLIGVVCC